MKRITLNLIEPVNYPKGDRYSAREGTHYGIDYPAPRGTVVKASEDGKVIRGSFNSGYGYVVIINHTSYDGLEDKDKKDRRHIYTLYAHLYGPNVSGGQKVKKGDTIGYVGNTGKTYSTTGGDGSHLHFEVIDTGEKGGRMDWGTSGPTNYEKHENRKNPEKNYFNHDITIEYPFTEEEMKKIQGSLDLDTHIDFKRGTWRIDVMLGGKKAGSIDRHNKEIKLSLSREKVEEILTRPPVSPKEKVLYIR